MKQSSWPPDGVRRYECRLPEAPLNDTVNVAGLSIYNDNNDDDSYAAIGISNINVHITAKAN
jgi:hypothetical protein